MINVGGCEPAYLILAPLWKKDSFVASSYLTVEHPLSHGSFLARTRSCLGPPRPVKKMRCTVAVVGVGTGESQSASRLSRKDVLLNRTRFLPILGWRDDLKSEVLEILVSDEGMKHHNFLTIPKLKRVRGNLSPDFPGNKLLIHIFFLPLGYAKHCKSSRTFAMSTG